LVAVPGSRRDPKRIRVDAGPRRQILTRDFDRREFGLLIDAVAAGENAHFDERCGGIADRRTAPPRDAAARRRVAGGGAHDDVNAWLHRLEREAMLGEQFARHLDRWARARHRTHAQIGRDQRRAVDEPESGTREPVERGAERFTHLDAGGQCAREQQQESAPGGRPGPQSAWHAGMLAAAGQRRAGPITS